MLWLTNESVGFPPPEFANEDGILAVGGDVSVASLLRAYHQGIFPWFNPEDIPVWWCPDPRFVLYPEELKISKSMRQILRREIFSVTFDLRFEEVMRHCGTTPRRGQRGTWVSDELITSFTELHRRGLAHSIEVWEGEQLVGGLYGMIIGKVFCGESMFSHVNNASKVGFITWVQHLIALGCTLIDCQYHSNHLESLGARHIPRKEFLRILRT